jgi:HemY protein
MRFALWFMALFGIAAASALFAGDNHATVTVFWAPHRVDLSLNLVLLCLALSFLVLHLALRALAAMFSIPQQARRWRLQQKERAIYAALLDALSHLVVGRFIRSRKAAELVVSLEASVAESGEALTHAERLRTITHLIAAESAHALQDKTLRDSHFQQSLEIASSRDAQDARDGVHLRAARWALDDRDATAAVAWLDQLPQGASRRTVALRLRLKAARMAGRNLEALETVRLLSKHRALSDTAGKSIARGLALELVRASYDPVQLQRAWDALDATERHMPDVAMEAAQRLLTLGGAAALARQWLLPAWEGMTQRVDTLQLAQRVRLVRVLEQSFGSSSDAPDAVWLAKVEAAQMANPREAVLQYLAGVVCMRLQLWGKAQQLLKQSLPLLQDAELRRDAWRALAAIAEQRQDTTAATDAYREALNQVAKPL